MNGSDMKLSKESPRRKPQGEGGCIGWVGTGGEVGTHCGLQSRPGDGTGPGQVPRRQHSPERPGGTRGGGDEQGQRSPAHKKTAPIGTGRWNLKEGVQEGVPQFSCPQVYQVQSEGKKKRGCENSGKGGSSPLPGPVVHIRALLPCLLPASWAVLPSILAHPSGPHHRKPSQPWSMLLPCLPLSPRSSLFPLISVLPNRVRTMGPSSHPHLVGYSIWPPGN